MHRLIHLNYIYHTFKLYERSEVSDLCPRATFGFKRWCPHMAVMVALQLCLLIIVTLLLHTRLSLSSEVCDICDSFLQICNFISDPSDTVLSFLESAASTTFLWNASIFLSAYKVLHTRRYNIHIQSKAIVATSHKAVGSSHRQRYKLQWRQL
jgi:hypothetical protein